jgi:hypothetical protein
VKSTHHEASHYAILSTLLLFLLRSKYSPQKLFSGTLNQCSSLTVKDKVLHQHKTTGKMIFNISIFKFLGRRRKDKRLERRTAKYSLNLTCP